MDQVKSTSDDPEADKQEAKSGPPRVAVSKGETLDHANTHESKNDRGETNPDFQISPITAQKLRITHRIWAWIKRDTTSTEWLIVLLTSVIAITSYLQWHEIRGGSADTHTLALAAEAQAKKMSDMSDAADKIRHAAEDMVIQDQRIADNAKKAMDESNRQSKAVLDATIAASSLDQRAWIGIGVFRVVQFDKDILKVDIEIRNSGKTPALVVSEGAKYGSNFTLESGPQQNWFVNLPLVSAEAIPPGGSHTIHLAVGSDAISPIFDGVKSKAFRIYVFGEIKYTDISRKVNGVTDFCLFMSDPEKLDLGFCGTHNDMK